MTCEDVLVSEDGAERPARAALGRLVFDYDGQSCAPIATDYAEPVAPWRRRDAESQMQAVLEGLGANEIAQIEGLLPDYDSQANYFIAFDNERDLGASFSAHAVPQLMELGFVVEFEPRYPFLVAPIRSPFYANVSAGAQPDWFVIELGIEIDGRPYNLVPGLLELLESCSEPLDWKRLVQAPGRGRAVGLGDGRYAVLAPERLQKILQVLADLCLFPTAGQSQLELPIAGLLGLCDLADALEDGQAVRGLTDSEWLIRARRLKAGPEFSPKPAALRAELRPYQQQGLTWLEHKRDAGVGAVVADDMGLGKTLQTIALLTREKEARRMELPSLVVAPKSLVFNWQREFKKFAPHLRTTCYVGKDRHRQRHRLATAEVVLTSYPTLTRDRSLFEQQTWHYLVVDEAQTIKNDRGQASLAVRALTARHRVALTGTPIENNLGELWALFDFSHPGLLGKKPEFVRQFREPIERHFDELKLELLKKRVSPFILRRLKEDVAPDLPDKTELVRAVELSTAQRDLYEGIRLAGDRAVRAAIFERGFAAAKVTVLQALTKLRQVCCDPRLLSLPSAEHATESAKYDAFFELLTAQLAQGRRVLVFSQFTGMLSLLAQGLDERGIGHLLLTGKTIDRRHVVDQFESGRSDVFLISLKAGGTGLNLVSADTVIHYDPWWNAAAQMQATDRAYRIGQKKPVFVYKLIAASSVEQRILALQQRKRNLADQLLGQAPVGEMLDEQSVCDLFAPLDDDPQEQDCEDSSDSSLWSSQRV